VTNKKLNKVILIAYGRAPYGLRHNYLSDEFYGVTQPTGSVVTSPVFVIMCFIFTI